MIIEIDNHCPGRNLKCCDGCQRKGEGSFWPELRNGTRGQADYCVDRVMSPGEIQRELEGMPL